MKAAIVGYGVEGQVSAKYWYDLGYEITICDQDETIALPGDYQKQLGQNYLDNLSNFDVIVRSAGINPRVITSRYPNIYSKITTGIQEFFRVCPTKNIIGITGTKGKGTTTTLVCKMLEAAGKTVHVGGNIGIAALELLPAIQQDDWVVLELSSFQLQDFKGPSPHIAVCLMVVPEHLNWHSDMQDYVKAKSQLFAYQKENDFAIYYFDSPNSKQIASASPGIRIPYMLGPGAIVNSQHIEIDGNKICHVNDVMLPGKHNWQNVCAAVTAVWQVTQNINAISAVITSFSGLEHRIEFVRELNSVKYYDDSFATTPETAIAAIQAFSQPKVLILGGSDKGIPLEPIADEVARNNVRHVITIGEMGPVIEKQLRKNGFNDITSGPKSMSEIITSAREKAKPGDVVLLSTGCASFGLFKDYKDRGNQFKDSVNSLA